MADETKCLVCDMPLYQHGAGTNCIRYLMEKVERLETEKKDAWESGYQAAMAEAYSTETYQEEEQHG